MGNKMKILHWSLCNTRWEKNCILAWGVLKGDHPRIADGTYIHTSEIEECNIEEDKFLISTYSKSLYELDFDEIDVDAIEKIKESLKVLLKDKYNEKLIDKVVNDKKENNKKLEKELQDTLENNYLYLEMSGDYFVKGYFKCNNEIFKCDSDTHIGTFVDSILIGIPGKVDFRYFPKGDSIEIYHWSNGLDAIVINNISKYDVVVYGCKKTIIEGNSRKIIKKDDGKKEGLISPDNVDGSCLLNQN